MFEALKQKPTGMSPRERTRLIVSIAGIVVLGGLIFGGGLGAIAGGGGIKRPALATSSPREGRTLDAEAFASLRETAPTALDTTALRHVLAQVAEDRGLRRRALPADRADRERLLDRLLSTTVAVAGTPKDLVALDSKARAGALVEVAGTVRSATTAPFSIDELGAQRRLWAFVVEGDDGSKVAVIDGAVPRDWRPPDAVPAVDEDVTDEDAVDPATQRPPLADGMRVHVRAFYLQRVAGPLGPLSFDAPVPLLVGREYRPALGPVPVVPSLGQVAWDEVRDRSREETWRTEDLAVDMALRWAADRGHAAIVASIRSKELPYARWARPTFIRWMNEIEVERPRDDARGADPRSFTRGSRGKVFLLSGVLASYEREDWDRVPDNAYDVRQRYVYRLQSDHYASDVLIPFVSPFPIEAFAGIARPELMGPDVRPQRIRIYGVFARNFSYSPRGPTSPGARAEFDRRKEIDITVPMFVALHVELDSLARPTSFFQNALFVVGCVLALLVIGFWLVMRRVDRREDERLREREARSRRRVFALDVSSRTGGSSTGTSSPHPSGPASPPQRDAAGPGAPPL